VNAPAGEPSVSGAQVVRRQRAFKNHAMKQIRILAILATVVGAAALVSLELARPAPERIASDPLRQDPNLAALTIPAFAFTDQDGETVTDEILDGRVTVLDFFFSSCPFVCPPMGRNMAHAQQALEGTGTRFVSISVDPQRDTPERLSEYAASLGADLSTWTFLTGEDRAQQNRILSDGLMLPELAIDETRTIPLGDGETMPNIAHPSLFILIGPDRRILTLANGTLREEVDRLIERAHEAASAISVQPSSGSTDS